MCCVVVNMFSGILRFVLIIIVIVVSFMVVGKMWIILFIIGFLVSSVLFRLLCNRLMK